MSLKVAFVGTGGFTSFHCKILAKLEGVRVTAFCGTSLDKAERLAAQWNGANAYTDVEQMLDRSAPDAVYICVPPMAHGAIEYALIERNIPFFVEKPLGLDDALPADILRRIQERSLITSVGYNMRYTDAAARAKELLKDRRVGMAIALWMSAMPGVPWWRKQDGSGGQFIEQTTHYVDLMRYLLGEADEVYAAYAKRYMHEAKEGVTVDDVGSVTFKLSGGAIVTIANTCMLPETNKLTFNIYTDQGALELSPSSLKDTRPGIVTEYLNVADPYAKEHEAFLHAVRTQDDSRILSTYEDSCRTQQLTVAALRSATTGQSVRLK